MCSVVNTIGSLLEQFSDLKQVITLTCIEIFMSLSQREGFLMLLSTILKLAANSEEKIKRLSSLSLTKSASLPQEDCQSPYSPIHKGGPFVELIVTSLVKTSSPGVQKALLCFCKAVLGMADIKMTAQLFSAFDSVLEKSRDELKQQIMNEKNVL